MQKLPIGIQNFRELRNGGFLYVDKTEDIYHLVTTGKYFFLSRPRRFGKSLLVSTMEELFSGAQNLFQGLWLADKWDWGKTHPVLHISFGSIGYKELGLEGALHRYLDKVIAHYGFDIQEEALSQKFKELLLFLSSEKGQVVLLIDEYDKPIIDYIGGAIEQAQDHQEVLRKFYSIIKDSDPYLRLVFITGVSKFSRVSIFSDLNNLEDLTIEDYRTAGMTGYTQKEVEHYFKDYIFLVAERLKMTVPELLQQIKKWYNGYSWDTEVFVYNPFSILNFFKKAKFLNFWFQTATPAFLIQLIKKQTYYDFDGVEVGQEIFDAFEIKEHIDAITLLFQTGYLTMKSVNEFGVYKLGYPNEEVRRSMLGYLIGAFAEKDPKEIAPLAVKLREGLLNNDMEQIIEIFNTLLRSLPYQLKEKQERFFHAVIHLMFQMAGIYLQSEVNTHRGRADTIIETKNRVWCFEFKLNHSANAAIEQIKERGYLDAYKVSGKELVAVGINFSVQRAEIDDWAVEVVA